MRRQQARFLVVERLEVVVHRLRHGYEGVDAADEVLGQNLVARPVFVRYYVVKYGYDLGLSVALHYARYRAEAWRHERQPELDDEQVSVLLLQFASHFYPVEQIYGVDLALYVKVFGARVWRILRFAGEEERGVLQGEGEYLHLVALLDVLSGYPFVEIGYAASVRPRRTNDQYLHYCVLL